MSEHFAEKDVTPEPADHECDSGYFDRTLCACGAMHSYCDTCGERDDSCPLDEDPPRFATVDDR